VQGAASAIGHLLSPLEVVQGAALFFFFFFSFPPLLFSAENIDRVCGEQVVTMDKLG